MRKVVCDKCGEEIPVVHYGLGSRIVTLPDAMGIATVRFPSGLDLHDECALAILHNASELRRFTAIELADEYSYLYGHTRIHK